MNTKDIIKFCFAHEKDIEQAVFLAKNDSGGHSGGNNGHCRVSDPTALAAIRHVEDLPCVDVEYGPKGCKEIFKLYFPEQWLRVVKEVKANYSNKLVQRKIIELHFVLDLPVREICEQIGIGRSAYFVMVQDILTASEWLAKGMGIWNVTRFKK